jgi:hypothetical protein
MFGNDTVKRVSYGASVVLQVVGVLSNASRHRSFSEEFSRQGTEAAIIGAIEQAP